MSTAQPETSSLPSQRTTRSRSQRQAPRQPQSQSKAQPHSRAKTKPKKKPKNNWYEIRDIVNEKSENGKIYYLVDWEGTDENGLSHTPTWEPESNVTDFAIDAWKDKQKQKQNKSSASIKSTLISQDSHQLPNLEIDSPQPPTLPVQTRDKKIKRSLDDSSEDESKSDKGPARKRHQTKSVSESSNTSDTGSELGKDLAGRGACDSKLQAIGKISVGLGDNKGGSRRQITVELPQNPSINPLEYDRLSFSRATTATSKGSSSSSRPTTAHSHVAKIKRDEHQVIPDSQGTSQGTLGSFLSVDQQDSASRPSTGTNQSQPPVNSGKTSSQSTISQAAQIVVPLISQHDPLVTQSHDNFTVYDDSVSPSAASKSQVQSNSQHSSQALNEVDSNTRSAKSTNRVGIESRASGRVELSQGESGKHANSEVESPVRPGGKFSTPEQQTTIMNRDDTPSKPMSAKERLKFIRESNFALLNSSNPSQQLPTITTTNTNPSAGPIGSTISIADGQGPQNIEVPPPDISPLTPTPLVSPTLLTQSLPVTQDTPANAQHSLIPDATQESVGQEQHGELRLEDSEPVTDYGAPLEEQLATTLDPSNLTLSIENDMDIAPSISMDDPLAPSLPLQSDFIPAEEESQYYPPSLLPYVPAGPSEYLITLPFHNSVRPVYNDILRESEDLVREYNDSFRVLPYQKPHPTTIAKLDEMFSRLLDVCDLPPFMETIPGMDPTQITKHVLNTNAKFAFVGELLRLLAEAESDKKVLILARPGKVIEFLGYVIETRGYRYVRSGLEIVGSSAEHSLAVAISSTLDSPSSIPEDVDVVIAFDHTYRPELLPASIRERNLILMVLTSMCSIQHINMRIADNIEPLERKNALVLSLVKAMRHVEEPEDSLIQRMPESAERFAQQILSPDEDDFYWEPLEVPEDVFEDLHDSSSQLLSQPSLQGLGSEQLPGSRKRSHEGDDDETSSKRIRMSQPTVVSNMSHISDSLKQLIGDDFVGSSTKAAFSVSINKLEVLAAKVATLEAKFEESKQREKQFRNLSNRSKKELDDYTSTLRMLQKKYMTALKDRGTFEADLHKAKNENTTLQSTIKTSKELGRKLTERNDELEKKLSEANEMLLNSSNPEPAKMAGMEKEIDDLKKKTQALERKVTISQNDMEYAKSAYQDASQRAGELQTENRALEQQVTELTRRADANVVEVNRIQAANEVAELVRMIEEQKNALRDRDAELGAVKEELKLLKESRRGTRQSSVPRSPRLSAFANSPRNGRGGNGNGNGKAGSSSSRGTSPAPPPTGVFEAGSGAGTPVGARHSHLRETRF